MLVRPCSLIVVFKQDLIKNVLPSICIPNLQLLSQQIDSLVHKSYFLGLYKRFLLTLWYHWFFHLHLFHYWWCHYLCTSCVWTAIRLIITALMRSLLLLFGASLRCGPTFDAHSFGYGGHPSLFRLCGPVFGTGLTLRKFGLRPLRRPRDVWYRMHQRRWRFWHLKRLQFISATIHMDWGLFITTDSVVHGWFLMAQGRMVNWNIETIFIYSLSVSLAVGSRSLNSSLLVKFSSFNLFLYIIQVILVLLNHLFTFK